MMSKLSDIEQSESINFSPLSAFENASLAKEAYDTIDSLGKHENS